MKPGEFELDMAGIARVCNEQQAVEVLHRRTEAVVSEARRDPRAAHGGQHQVDLITIGETHETKDGAVVDIDWASHFWHLIEFGSRNNPPYRPITRAAQNNGLQVIDARGGT